MLVAAAPAAVAAPQVNKLQLFEVSNKSFSQQNLFEQLSKKLEAEADKQESSSVNVDADGLAEQREIEKKEAFEKKRADHYKIDFAAIRKAQAEEDAE